MLFVVVQRSRYDHMIREMIDICWEIIDILSKMIDKSREMIDIFSHSHEGVESDFISKINSIISLFTVI